MLRLRTALRAGFSSSLVGERGLEPPASRSPACTCLVGVRGIGPPTSRSQTERSTDELHSAAMAGIIAIPRITMKCRERESNSHARLKAKALKALVSAIPPPRRV